jgi:uncharacterized protein YkwD
MTLAKTKPSKRTATAHRKRAGSHHRKGHNYTKAYWPYLPIVAIITVGVILNSWLGSVHHSVLGYATDMSVSGLLSGTNQQRAANGLGALALNDTLNQAAQAKANDMMVHDYWAHVSPSGTTPWYWFSSVGYSYQTAGENLAYGFTTSSETIAGWMNSAGHRANILNGSFQEVGFGVVNAPSYQGSGPQTIVVAMYAQPATPVVTPAPAPVALSSPAPAAATKPAPTASSTPAPVTTTPTPVTDPSAEQQTPAQPTGEQAPEAQKDTPVAVASSGGGVRSEDTQKITRVEVLSAANASWSGFAVSMIASIALLAFLLRHSLAWHRAIVKGEHFILKHPLLDIVFVAVAVLGFILTQTSGLIK